MAQPPDQESVAETHNLRGIELADRGWLDEAEKEFRKAIQVAPESPHAYDNLGTILADRGQPLDALDLFLRAIQCAPHLSSTHHYLACFLSEHAAALTEAQFRKAIELDPHSVDAHLNLGLAMATQKRHQEALLYLRRANELAPDDDTVLHELACSLIDIEAYPEAIQYLKALLKRTPTHINALIDLGIAYTAQGFLEEAENVLGQALEHDEFDFGAHYHIAALYAASERFGEAFDHLDVCLGQDRSKCLMWMRDDSIFDTLRDNKRFEELMRKGQDYEDPSSEQ